MRGLSDFLTTWNEQYSNYTDKDKTKETLDETWRQQLPQHLTNLTEILSIEKILPILSKHNIQNLILIPHRDLHRLPLHALFPQSIKTRYLPTLHLTSKTPLLLALPSRRVGGRGDLRLLSIEAPDSIDLEFGKELGSLSYAAIESAYICQAIGDPLYRIADEAATKDQVIAALTQGCEIFHFTGHAGYNFNSPKQSALCLSKKDRLTIEELVKIPLDGCELVCLSACETGITGKQTILDEYVGLVSAFLSQGVGTVVSTLWQVQSAASAIIMMEFYRRRQNLDDITALHETTHWLRSATAQDLINWCGTMQTEDQPRKVNRFLKAEIVILSTLEETDKPYSDPYHWAAYTITGG